MPPIDVTNQPSCVKLSIDEMKVIISEQTAEIERSPRMGETRNAMMTPARRLFLFFPAVGRRASGIPTIRYGRALFPEGAPSAAD